jgi:O-antigen ligase
MFDHLLLFGIFISLLAGQFARIELINALANVYIHEFLLIIFIIKSFIRFGIAPLQKVFKSKIILVFIVLILVSYLVSLTEFSLLQNAIALLYLVRLMVYVLFGIYLFNLMKKNKNIGIFLSKLIFIFSIVLLIITAIQFIFFPNFWGLYKFGWDPHLYRASAIYLDIFIAAALYGLLSFYWYSKDQKGMTFFFVIALVLSFSRSAYIAFVVALLYLFIAQKKWKELFISLTLFSLFIILVPKPFGEGGNLLRTSSIKSRILDYNLGITLWQKKPLLGFGYNRIRFAKEQLNLISIDDRSHSLSAFHSSFLVILVTTGIAGFLSSLYLIGSFLKKYPRMRVYVLYILVMSLFDNVLLHVLVLLPLLFIAVDTTQSSFE